MAEDVVHQALFGYAKGHRMLVASRPIPTEAGRALRAATDTGVERSDARYLTVLPIPELRAQAFIRTWAAEEWLRPGSVWSHVLLVDFLSLGNYDRLRGILAAFRRPHVAAGVTEPDLDPYRAPLQAGAVLDLPLADANGAFNQQLAAEIFTHIYGSDERITLAVPDAAAVEPLLLAIHEQQWPRLRRHFAFRTRLRASDGSQPFDLDVVERTRTTSAAHDVPRRPWIKPLLDDLEQPNGGDLRRFLRAFGPESKKGRLDVPQLVSIHTSISVAPATAAVAGLCRAFPRPPQMRALKRALLGNDAAGGWVPPPTWPARDPDRLALLFAAGMAVDYDDLDVANRLTQVIESAPEAAAAALHQLDLERLPANMVQTLVDAMVANASDDAATVIATDQPDLGLLLVSQRLALLGRPAVWDALDPDLLIELYNRGSDDQRHAVLSALLEADGADALIALCTTTPTTWWDLLFAAAQRPASDAAIANRAAVLRRVLSRVGAAAIGDPTRAPRAEGELAALLLSADISAGVWRHAPVDAWLRLCRGAAHPRPLRDRIAVVALLAAAASGSRQRRVEAWRATFPDLHHLLERADFDEEAWKALAPALPAAPEWDRCLRLRRGAVAEMRRDRWSPGDASALIDSAGRYRSEMVNELQMTPAKKKGKHWLRELVDALLP